MTRWDHLKWWWCRVVIQRLNGERKAADEYDRMHNLGKWRDRCYCCGSRDLMWHKGDHALALVSICRPCKFGACEECR